MTSSDNIYIFKYSADGDKFEKDAIGQTPFQKDTKNKNAIIYEGSVRGNSNKTSNSETPNSKQQNFKTSNKSEFSNKQTENKGNGYNSSTSFNTSLPLTPPPFNDVKSSATRNISSKFEFASLSNQMENINNAGDISKYINALMDEDNSRQSSLIQNKIKVFQSKIEKKGTNKDETVRKSNANLSLIKKDFGGRREHKDLAKIKKNTDVVLKKDEGSILKEDKSFLNKDENSNFNGQRDSALNSNKNFKLFNFYSRKKEIAAAPINEPKIKYKLTNIMGEPSDWIKNYGLQFISVAEAKKVFLGSAHSKANAKEENIRFQSNKRSDSSLHNTSEYNGHIANGYNDSYSSGKSSSSSKHSQTAELTDVQIITRNEPTSLEPINTINSRMQRTKISNDGIIKPNESTTTSVKSLVKEFSAKKRQNPPKSSTWRGRPKSSLISTSIMSFGGEKESPTNAQTNAVENNTSQMERKRRKSLNIDIATIPTIKYSNLGTDNQLNSKQQTLSITKDIKKPQNLWAKDFEKNQNIRNVYNNNSTYKNDRSTSNQWNPSKVQNENSVETHANECAAKPLSKSPSIPIPPTPPSSPQNDPLSPSQFSLFSDNALTDPVSKYVSKKKNNSPPSSDELKSTLKRELERNFLKMKHDVIDNTEEKSTNSLNDFEEANTFNGSSTDASTKPSLVIPENKSLRSSIANGREKYEISFEYKMKEYETKDKFTKKWERNEKSQKEDSQFAASMKKLRQDNALDKMFVRANGPSKGKKFIPSDDQRENEANSMSLSFAYHIGEKTKEEKEFEEGWVSVSDATTVTNKKKEPPVDYQFTYENNKKSTQILAPPPPPPTSSSTNHSPPPLPHIPSPSYNDATSPVPPPPPPPPPTTSSTHISPSPSLPHIPSPSYNDASSPVPPPPPPPPPMTFSTHISSSPSHPHIPSPTYNDAPSPMPPPVPPSNNRSQRSRSSSVVDNRRKSDGFNLQGIANGRYKEDQIKKEREEMEKSKKDELLGKEPNPDYD